MEITQYIIGITAATCLTTGWLGVQFLARKMRTKNHFEHLPSSCSDHARRCDGCSDEKVCER